MASRAAAQRGGEVAVPVGVQDAGGEVKAEVDGPADCGAWRRTSRPAGPSHGGRVHATSMDPQLMPIGRFRTSVPVEREAAAALRRAGPAAASVGIRAPAIATTGPSRPVRRCRSGGCGRLMCGWRPSGRCWPEGLGAVKDRLEADLVRRRRMLATLNRVLTEGLSRAEVRLTREDARRVAVTTAVGTVEEIGPVTSDCVARLGQALAAAGRRPRGPLLGLFPLDLTDQVTVRVAAEVDQDVAGTAREVLGGGWFAVATHLGPTTSSRSPPTPCWPGSASTGTRSAVACARATSDPQHTASEQLVTQRMIKLEEEHA